MHISCHCDIKRPWLLSGCHWNFLHWCNRSQLKLWRILFFLLLRLLHVLFYFLSFSFKLINQLIYNLILLISLFISCQKLTQQPFLPSRQSFNIRPIVNTWLVIDHILLILKIIIKLIFIFIKPVFLFTFINLIFFSRIQSIHHIQNLLLSLLIWVLQMLKSSIKAQSPLPLLTISFKSTQNTASHLYTFSPTSSHAQDYHSAFTSTPP